MYAWLLVCISPPPGFDPQMAQPIASPCTDYAILAHQLMTNIILKYM
jgi:hypothetical protein